MKKALKLVPRNVTSVQSVLEVLKADAEAGEVDELMYVYTSNDGSTSWGHSGLSSLYKTIGTLESLKYALINKGVE